MFQLLGFMLAGLGVVTVFRWVFVGSRPDAPKGACAGCGYDLGGSESWRCPECGQDVRDVGVIGRRAAPTRERALVSGVFGVSLLWIFGVLLFAVLGVPAPLEDVDRTHVRTVLCPEDQSYACVDAQAISLNRWTGRGEELVALGLSTSEPGQPTARLAMQGPRSWALWVGARRVAHGSALAPSVTDRWLRAGGVSLSPELQAAWSVHWADVVRAAADHGPSTLKRSGWSGAGDVTLSAQGGSTSYRSRMALRPFGWSGLVVYAVWLAVLGAMLLVWFRAPRWTATLVRRARQWLYARGGSGT
jgi:rubredoxin